MSYYNHRNYQLDHRNRRAAQINQNKWTAAKNAQLRAINQVKGDWLRYGSRSGRPDAAEWRDMFIASAAQPHGEQMEQAHNDRMAAMQNYMDNEMSQVQDRMADMGENRIISKNRSDEMAASLKNKEIDAAERMNNTNANALNSMGQSLLSGSKVGVESPQVNTPNTNLYDRQGKRIGGTYFR